MADIVCRLKDYSMLEVDVDHGVAAELSDYFSFFVPGYRFMPSYKNKIWDGKIRLFNRIAGELNSGLYVYLLKFAKERGYTVDTEETSYGFPVNAKKIDTHKFNDFLETLNLPFLPYEYQYDAVLHGLKYDRGILKSPTGSGKSFIIYILMQCCLRKVNNKKILIIVPTTSLVEQLYSDFESYGMDVDNEVHKIYSGKDKTTDKKVIISTWQSIYKFQPIWFKQFGAVFGDECHGFKSKSLSSIMNKSTEARYRFGLTGTLDGTQTHKLVLEGLFGPVYNVVKTKELQDDGTLAPLKIKMLNLKYSDTYRQNVSAMTYQDEIDFIVKHSPRNNFLTNLAIDCKGNTLVLYHRVEAHGKPLFDLINSKAAEGRKVFFVSGDVATADREAIRKIVEKQKDAIIVASMGTFSTGINIKNLHNIIFASPSKSQIKVLQSIGRGLRQSEDGRETTLYDVVDDLSWKRSKNFALKHGAERAKIYKNEQFEFKIYGIDIK